MGTMRSAPRAAARWQWIGVCLGLSLALASAGPARACPGDCDDSGAVVIAELILGINIALGRDVVAACSSMDSNFDARVTIDELLLAVNSAFSCVDAPTATPTPEDTAPASTPTATPPNTMLPTPTPTDADATPSVTPTATSIPTGHPTDLTATVEGELVRLRWTAPDPGTGIAQFIVLRRLNAPVAGPQDPDATEVFFGPTDTAFDEVAALLPDTAGTARTYSYAVYGCTDTTLDSCETVGSSTTLAVTLAQALRAGGYTIAWRHADADVCADVLSCGSAAAPVVPDWWKSCDRACPSMTGDQCMLEGGTATARQLNDAGVAHATAIGAVFDALAIPVGRVISSEFCRNFTTAELMDFGPEIELDPEITYYVYDDADRCEQSYELINEVPAVGTNTAIIGHAGIANGCPVLNELAWSEAAIFKPDGQGGNTLIVRVPWDQWPEP